MDISQRYTGDSLVLRVGGEVDLATAPQLWRNVAAALNEPGLVLDLRPVTFIDCAGLSVLVRTRNLLAWNERRLLLVVGTNRAVQRLLWATGLTDTFDLLGDLPHALTQ